jgi:hypothetical protein
MPPLRSLTCPGLPCRESATRTRQRFASQTRESPSMSHPQPSASEHVESGTRTPSPAALLLPRHVTLLLYNYEYTQPRILRPCHCSISYQLVQVHCLGSHWCILLCCCQSLRPSLDVRGHANYFYGHISFLTISTIYLCIQSTKRRDHVEKLLSWHPRTLSI